MQLDNHTAIIDNDFTSHLVDCHLSDQKLIDDLRIIFFELGLSAVMHPLVYENELLRDKHRVRLLFEQNVIYWQNPRNCKFTGAISAGNLLNGKGNNIRKGV